MLNISDRFAAQCSPVIGSNYDTCGTVTRATINHLNVSELTALFMPGGLFADLDAWFLHSIEMKACGTKRNAFYDWIMANAEHTEFKAAMNAIKGVKTESLLQPFVFGKQDTVVNRDYWKVVCGCPKSGYTTNANLTVCSGPNTMTGPLVLAAGVATDRIIRIQSRYLVPVDAAFFRHQAHLNGDVIYIFGRSGGTNQVGSWQVLDAASAPDSSYCDVLVTSLNNSLSTGSYASAPNTGVALLGINNVSDYEKFCKNLPTIDPRKRVPFWMQTFRRTRCVDSEYQLVYEKLLATNPAFREFGDLPLAERNRQDESEEQHRFVVSFLYQKEISDQQTLTLWENLESIYTVTGATVDPGLGGKLIGKRANFIGVREQLRKCGQVIDLGNQTLNLLEWLDQNYAIKRARESQGRKVTDIDWYTNSFFRAQFQTAMMQYYKNQYLGQLHINVEYNKVNELGMVYDSYYVKRPGGVRINIISDNFFDDFKDQFDDQQIGSAGNMLLCLDIGKPGPQGGTIYYAMTASNRKTYTTARLEELAKLDQTFRCTMAYISQDQTLTSEQGIVVVECPLNSLIIEGIAENVPNNDPETYPYLSLTD